MNVLAERYKDRTGGFVRIYKNGFNASGSDRASRAIVELIDNPKDLMYLRATKHGAQLIQKLEEIELQKYDREVIDLKHPKTGESISMFKLESKNGMNAIARARWTMREVSVHKQLHKMRNALRSYPKAREADLRASQSIQDSKTHEMMLELQSQLDKRLSTHRRVSELFKAKVKSLGFAIQDSKIVYQPISHLQPTTTEVMVESGTQEASIAEENVVQDANDVQKTDEPQTFTQKLFNRFFK